MRVCTEFDWLKIRSNIAALLIYKAKFTLEQTRKIQWRSTGIALLFL
jgi:hypothetical protein